MQAKRYYKIITPQSPKTDVTDNQELSATSGLYGNYTWYHRLIQGSPSRLNRYKEYDLMDSDVDVARALDIIAEEMTGNISKGELPFKINVTDRSLSSSAIITLNSALKTWCEIHKWKKRIYEICRMMIKYGDCFFIKPEKKNGKYQYTHISNVIAAIVSQDDISDVRGWHVKMDSKTVNQTGSGAFVMNPSGNSVGDKEVRPMGSERILRFTINDEMSEEAPFGESVLRTVYRTFKQKELLEDALLIYRIVRAPERLVFKIYTAGMHPAKVAQHLEKIKAEINQKKIPTLSGGRSSVDSVYNPASMQENYYFAQGKNGEGSTVEQLAGGQGLGDLQDLDYFFNKMWRGLRIPRSFTDSTAEGGGVANDGKVGIAYLQEIKFSQYVERLQSYVEEPMDEEFKEFLRVNSIQVDPTAFYLSMPSPSNFNVSKKQEMDSALLNTFQAADGIGSLSKRFGLMKYLQLSNEEMAINERMLREEKGLPAEGEDWRYLPKLYSPDDAEAGGFEGGFAGGFGGSPQERPSDAELDDEISPEGDLGADDTEAEEPSPEEGEGETETTPPEEGEEAPQTPPQR